ncbi:MAG: hypothetical protein EP330_02880 [Deltaproteobacteria bacterium]|nr:MAG: hypothetical protein EP330_02880 [Deltaproteobacteria bacterium]
MPETFADPPVIDEVAWSCAEGERVLEVWSTSVTAGGMLWMDDGERRERHPVPSVAAEADDSADYLRLRLELIEDPAMVELGTSSAFLCGEAITRQLYLTSQAQQPADCVVDPDFPGIDGLGPCENSWL